LGDELGAMTLDLGMDDRVQDLELLGLVEDDTPQRGAVESAIGRQYRRPPLPYDLVEGRRAALDGSTGQDVGVDDRRSALGQELRDGGLARGDVAGQSDEKHARGTRESGRDFVGRR